MITSTEAAAIAAACLTEKNLTGYGYTPQVVAEGIVEVSGGFLVPWNSAEYLRTQDYRHLVVGNLPLFVDASSGECDYVTEEQLARFDAEQES
ncbi:YrhB domain-containing protein [Kitasatospora sp. NPDC058965]|uniref:YrhB domain-containing protein n=1 Tax=Kitasatospora sp. NPDC058965 TaxID=3346682 RepID=UPI00369006EA